MADIENTPRVLEQAVESRLEYETLIADLSSRFIGLMPGEVDGAIQDALRQVCEFLGVDYAVLWQWSVGSAAAATPTHAYPAQQSPRSQAPAAQDDYPWTVRQMQAGHVVVIRTLQDLPAEAALDFKSARLRGIRSNLCLPLTVGGESPIGALAFNAIREERDWPDALVRRLQLVAQVFASALARKRAGDALRESEERLSLAADAAEAGLWSLDYTNRTFWATARTRAIFGFAPDEVITPERLLGAIHPDDRGVVRETIERSARSGEADAVMCRVLTGQGGDRWILSRGRAHPTSAGEPKLVMGVSIDISERRAEGEALRASEARLASGAELAGLAFYEVDFGAGTVYVDDRLRDLCGVPPDQQDLRVLDFWVEHLHPDDRPWVIQLRRELHAGERDRFSCEYRYLHPMRGEMWIQHLAGAAAHDTRGSAVRTYGVIRDVTERKRAEEELRDLSRRLIGAHEEERALLARELHDDVSQRLAVLAIEAGRAELAAPDGQQAEAMQAIREELVRLSDDVHSLAYQLHPSILEELGLVEALRAEGERCARHGLHVWAHLDQLPDVVPENVALCLFRVAQEALSNVVRHAAANFATLRLRQADGGLSLAVSDDGVGFDRETLEKGMRLGLLSMRERVRLVNGTLDVESAPGHGTAILAWVPAEMESQ